MKKNFLYVGLIMFTLLACNKNKESESTPNKAAGSESTDKLTNVYVSSYPLYYFANRIGGDRIDLHFPMKSSNNVANWKAQPDSIFAMQNADLIFISGAGFENWLMNVSLPSNILVNTSKNYNDKLLSGGKIFTHSHGKGGEHEHTAKARTTWLDIQLAIKQAEVVANELSIKAPSNKNYFEANFKGLKQELESLDQQFKEVVAKNPNVKVVFSHPEYQYFQAAYKIDGESLHWEPSQKLTSKMVHDIEHLQKTNSIKYIIWEDEPLTDSKIALEKMGVKSVVISPILSMPTNVDFMEQLNNNLASLKNVYKTP